MHLNAHYCLTAILGRNQVDDLPTATSDDDGGANNYGDAAGNQNYKSWQKKQ